jgi:hypothetical protein
MLELIVVILLVLWLAGLWHPTPIGQGVHGLAVLAVILIVVLILQRRGV